MGRRMGKGKGGKTNEAVQRVVPADEVEAFGIVPGEALSWEEAHFRGFSVGEGDHAVVYGDVGPKLAEFGEVVGLEWGGCFDWDGRFALEIC